MTRSELMTPGQQVASDTSSNVPRPASKFFEQAAATPSALAVVDERGTHTYASVSILVMAIKRQLESLSIGPSDYVTIVGVRSMALIASMIAVNATGAAFFLIHPKSPIQRVRTQLKVLDPCVAIAIDDVDVRFATVDLRLPSVMRIDDLDINGDLTPNCLPTIGRDTPAYIFFTSGSTGTPKAAIVAAAGFENHLAAKITDLELSAADQFAQIASQSFDIIVWQCFAPLLVGAVVSIVPDETTCDAQRLLDHVETHRVTALELVPSMLNMVLEETESSVRQRRLPSLRLIFSNAERLTATTCKRWLSLYPQVPLFNSWGATECSDDVTHIRIPSIDGDDDPPVGRPIPNTTVYVLDENLRPMHPGARGELYIGGVAVGLGYKNDVEKTKMSFLRACLRRWFLLMAIA